MIVSFRGSHSVANFIADAVFPLEATDLCTGCEAHTGFWTSWLEARANVLAAIKSAADSAPGYTVVVTGHSLGAAIAELAAANLRNDGYPCELYTYGSPRVGNLALAEYVTGQAGGNNRVTHLDDPVPRLPPMLLGYVHTSPEYWINKPTNDPVEASDIDEFTGYTETQGNAGTTGLDIDAHLWYFNAISACDDGMSDGSLKARGVELQRF